MSDHGNDGQPELDEWVQRLHDRLEALGAKYLDASWDDPADPEILSDRLLKQACASQLVLELAKALHELPLFEGSKGVAVLHDVSEALHGLCRGKKAPLLRPAVKGPQGGDDIKQRALKFKAVLAIRVLTTGHELSEAEAIKKVTEIFAKAGATGRKGGMLKETTVRDWNDKAHPQSSNCYDKMIHEEVASELENYEKDPRWPGTLEEALDWIKGLASTPTMASKSD